MITVLRFVISTVPPSVNAQKAAVAVRGKPRLIKTKEYRNWIERTTQELASQPGFTGDLAARPFIWRSDVLFPCNVSKQDIDNCNKAVIDILVSCGKVPDDRYLADCRIRWAKGNNIVVAIQKEELEKWTQIKQMSKSLIKKLAMNSPSMPHLL